MAAFIPFALMAAGTAISTIGKIQEGKEQSKQIEYEAQKTERAKSRMLSRQKALYAKSGVLLSEGSPLEVMADTAAQYEMDIRMQRQKAKAVKKLSYFGAGSTLLTGGAQAFSAFPTIGSKTGLEPATR